MIRVVALGKAVIAGVCGAAVMEAFFLVSRAAGLATVDLVAQLTSVQLQHSPWIAELLGLAGHLAIGVCWAIFYALFFWGRLHARPLLQGMVFALIPATGAILAVYPELALMHRSPDIVVLTAQSFWAPLSVEAAASLLASHLLFGLTIGAIYRRPVGYAVGTIPAPPSPWSRRSRRHRQEGSISFMFAAGIECSYPTIDHGKWRRDEMESTRHYRLWQEDFELAREIGITHIRYGPPLHLVFEGPGKYRWEYIDPQMQELQECGPEPIIDLCHFGLPS